MAVSSAGAAIASAPMLAIAKLFSGPLMAAAGINHFVMPRTYEAIMPDYLPAHRELVYASGVAELAAGIGTMIPATRRPAGRLLMATLVAVLPANVQMLQHPERYKRIPKAALWARLPLQGVLIFLAYMATQRDEPSVR